MTVTNVGINKAAYIQQGEQYSDSSSWHWRREATTSCL